MEIRHRLTILVLLTGFIFTNTSCKKNDDDNFRQENMAGQWTLAYTSQQAGSSLARVNLRNSGSAEFDVIPFDGVTDNLGTWKLNGTSFSITVFQGGSEVHFDGTLSKKTLSITGILDFKNGSQVDSGTFTMDKDN